MRIYLLFLLLLSSALSLAQPDFEEAYQYIYSDKIASNVGEAHRLADSLLQNSKGDLQKLRSHMLLATIDQNTGEIVSALEHALKALKIAELCGYTEWEARANGFAASAFRNVGLYSESLKALNKCDKINESQAGSKSYYLVKINILHERALFAMTQDDYHGAISAVEEAKRLAPLDSTGTAISLITKATSDQLLGVAYLNIQEYAKADSFLNNSLTMLGEQESNLRPYIYRGLAEVALEENNLKEAKYFLDKAEPYLDSSERTEFKLLLYQSFIKYYKDRDASEVKHYTDLYNDVLARKLLIETKVTEQILSYNEAKMRDFERLLTVIKFVAIALLGLLLLYAVFYTYKVVRLKKNIDTVTEENDTDVFMAEDTEKRLVQQLDMLEEKQLFLQPDISLSKLALHMGTNQKYVSYIIKKYRNKDFNECVQSCRIRYIVRRLNNEEDLLECKISYLASMCGFASHSKFSSAFKAEMDILPSVYIQNLRSPDRSENA